MFATLTRLAYNRSLRSLNASLTHLTKLPLKGEGIFWISVYFAKK